jgi:hypothetical protein
MQLIDLSSMAEADFQSGLQRALIRYPEIDLDRCKLIGFGAGYFFEKFCAQLPIKLAYTVCEWEIETGLIEEGGTKCGVRVHHARQLREENPNEVLIVIFSGRWYDCMRTVANYGPFKMMRAMAEPGVAGNLEYMLPAFFSEAPGLPPGQAESASIGLVVQGPVMAQLTPMSLAATRRKFPFATLVLSTWDNTSPALLSACAPYVDEIVTSPVPSQPGVLNAIMQRDTTLAGLVALEKRGVQYAFKTRSDQSIVGPVDMDQLLQLARYPIDGDESGRERILFCPYMSQRFKLFHLTDQLQFGRLADLLEFWRCRDDSILGPMMTPSPAPFTHLALVNAEGAIMRCYLRRIDVDYELTLASYWKIFADRFALMPPQISPILWKALALFDVPAPEDPRAAGMAQPASLLSYWRPGDWEQLRENRALFEEVANAVADLGLTMDDYAKDTLFDLALLGAPEPKAE